MQTDVRQKAVQEKDLSEKLNLKLTFKYLAAFFLLTLILGELHEQVHINTGWMVCGGYGARDFNAWKTAAECARPSLAFLATAVGPLFSYAVIWLGAILLMKAKSADFKSVGFTLIFAALPFARIFTAAMGGGDEKVVLRHFFDATFDPSMIKTIAFFMVTAVCLPPMIIAAKYIKNRFSVLYVAGFSILPLIVLSAYVLTFLNSVLSSGFLSAAPFLGTPLLVIFHFLTAATFLFFCRKWLFKLNAENGKTNKNAIERQSIFKSV